MKVVCCKNCGAKYQLDDDDDISAFECSSCSGDLEVVENYSDDDNSSKSTIITSQKYDDSYIVQCSECGLKYKLNKNDNILENPFLSFTFILNIYPKLSSKPNK